MSDRKVLVADDEEDCLSFVSAILEDMGGVSVTLARNGDEALAAARQETPDLIILDVQMPGKDGFACFADLKGDDATKAIPVVMLTGIAEKTGLRFSKADMGEYFDAEPAAYVEKPIDPEALSAVIRGILGEA